MGDKMPGDEGRGRSIVEGGIDDRRIYVTGLSAGGAMTSVMLATYPEVFAGGAIIAGLPYGSAKTVPEAFDRMRGHGGPTGRGLSALVRKASEHDGPWPTISVWHGSADRTVDSINALAIVEQWRGVHGLKASASSADEVAGHPRQSWSDASGRVLIDYYSITGLGHGTPLKTSGADSSGSAGAHMLEAGISSTVHIARSWGLVPATELAPAAETPKAPAMPTLSIIRPTREDGAKAARVASVPKAPAGVAKVIDDALRAAGLVR